MSVSPYEAGAGVIGGKAYAEMTWAEVFQPLAVKEALQ
jgi:hypothetical protein